MSKPTVLEHRSEIRTLLQEATAAQFTDAQIDQALAHALDVLSGYVTCMEKITLSGLTATQTVLDLSAETCAGAVLEVIPVGGAARSEFRPRGGELILLAPLGASSADVVFRSRFKHDGTSVDHYPPHLRGGVCLYAAGALILGHGRALAETDATKTVALTTLGIKFFDAALTIFGTRTTQR